MMLLRGQLQMWEDLLTDYQLKSRMMREYQVRLCVQKRWTYPMGASPIRTKVKVL